MQLTRLPRFATAITLLAALSPLTAVAETVSVQFRGPVTLDRFECEWAEGDVLIQRICYQTATNYLILGMNDGYVHYCRIAPGIVNGLRQSREKERYFKQFIRARYDCRAGGIPVG